MPDTNIPAPPDGSAIVDAPPVGSALDNAQIPAPPDGSRIVDTMPTVATAPNGMPANSMQAVANEKTPEGYAAAVAAREAQHPVVTGLGEAAGDVWDAVKSMANPLNTGLAGATTQAFEHIKEAVPLFQTYERARANGKTVIESLGAANAKAKQINDAQDVVKQRVDEFKKNPTVAATRAVADAAALAASMWSGGEPLEAPAPSAEAQAAATVTHVFVPGDAGEPGVLKQVWQGEKVAQPQAQEALRTGATAGSKEAGLSTVQPQSLRTVVEQPIDALQGSAKNLYQQVDNVAGTDFKALNEKLENTEYQIRQLTDTEEDAAQEAKLEKSRTSIMEKIATAKQQALDNGVDPKLLDQADAKYTQARALKDVEAKVFKNPNIVKGNSAMGTPETVDVDGTVKILQKLQDNEKYGAPRLEQALGKEGANNLLKHLYEAQRLGQKAIAKQEFIKTLANYAKIGGGLTALGGGAYELLK